MMNTLFLLLILFSTISLQAIFIGYYCLTFLNCNISKKVFLLICFFTVWISRVSVQNTTQLSGRYGVILFFIIAILMYVFFKDSLLKKAYHFLYLSCIFMIQNEFLTALIANDFTMNHVIRVMVIIVCATLFSFGFIMLLKIFVGNASDLFEAREYLLLSIFPLLSIILLILSWSLNTMTQLLIGSLLLVFMTANYYLYHYIGAKNELIQRQDSIRIQADFQNSILVHQKSLRKLNHDLKNMLLSVRAYADQADYIGISKVLDEIQRELPISHKKLSGCFVIDSVLSSKLATMDREQIGYTLDTLIPSDLALENKEIDISVILGNILDNAIEELERNNRDEKIQITLRYRDQKLMIRVINPTNNINLSIDKQRIKSSKKERRFGIGIASVRQRVEKLHGYTNFSIHGTSFEALMVIPF